MGALLYLFTNKHLLWLALNWGYREKGHGALSSRVSQLLHCAKGYGGRKNARRGAGSAGGPESLWNKKSRRAF